MSGNNGLKAAEGLQLTPTEQRMFRLLCDGMPHTREEMHACLDDELAESVGAVSQRVIQLRRKLEPGRSLDIVNYCRNHVFYYRMVALIIHQDDR